MPSRWPIGVRRCVEKLRIKRLTRSQKLALWHDLKRKAALHEGMMLSALYLFLSLILLFLAVGVVRPRWLSQTIGLVPRCRCFFGVFVCAAARLCRAFDDAAVCALLARFQRRWVWSGC